MQININISAELDKILGELSQATGQSKSSLCARYIYNGVFEDIERQNKLKLYRRWPNQQQEQKE